MIDRASMKRLKRHRGINRDMYMNRQEKLYRSLRKQQRTKVHQAPNGFNELANNLIDLHTLT